MAENIAVFGETKTFSNEEPKKVKKHLRRVKRQLYKNLMKAYVGWWHWFWICRTKGFGNTVVLLIPGEDQEVSYLALLYLDQMLDKRGYDNAIILTHDSIVIKAAPLFSKRILKVKYFSRKKAKALMQFYCLYEFNKKFICASLDEPFGRNGSSIIGKNGSTKEQIFVIGVYQIYPYNRPCMPAIGQEFEYSSFINIYNNL